MLNFRDEDVDEQDTAREHMHPRDIMEFQDPCTRRKYEDFWEKVELPGGPDDSCVCIKAKA